MTEYDFDKAEELRQFLLQRFIEENPLENLSDKNYFSAVMACHILNRQRPVVIVVDNIRGRANISLSCTLSLQEYERVLEYSYIPILRDRYRVRLNIYDNPLYASASAELAGSFSIGELTNAFHMLCRELEIYIQLQSGNHV